MMASVAFSDVLASAREPGTSRFSAIGMADALGIQFHDLAALAGVHRNTLRTPPASPRLQSALRDTMHVLSTASGVPPHTGRAFSMMRTEAIPALRHKRQVDLRQVRRRSYSEERKRTGKGE